MNLHFDYLIATGYKSNSQKVRVMSESWIAENMFCPCCGNNHITKLGNNSPVADMRCNNCKEIYELKAKGGKIGNKITDGAYKTMIDRITSDENPNLFVMMYSNSYCITDLVIIPKFFFVPQIIEKRKPLAPTAARAGWTGCNILYSSIPKQGKIEIIKNGNSYYADEIVKQYNKIKKLQTKNLEARGWLLDVLDCVNNINYNVFSLSDIYAYTEFLHQKHNKNNNVKAKIRQQLQILRDRGFIEFIGKGLYRKVD